MAEIIHNRFDSVHVAPSTEGSDGVVLSITGGAGLPRVGGEGQENSRSAFLTAGQARILAYALLTEAERLDEAAKT
jgi:hypothetical protein